MDDDFKSKGVNSENANETQSGVVDRKNMMSDADDEERYPDDEELWNPYEDVSENDTETEKDVVDGEEGSKDPDAADPDKPRQSVQENAAYQKIRQKAIADANKELEAKKAEIEAKERNLKEQEMQIHYSNIENKHLQAITDNDVWALADEKGWPEDAAREVLTSKARQAAVNEINQYKLQQHFNQQMKEAYANKPFFKDIEKKIDAYINSNPGVDIGVAYKFFLGDLVESGKTEEIIKQQKSNAQKQTIADVQDRSRRKSLNSDNGNVDVIDPKRYMPESGLKLARAFGNSAVEVAKSIREMEKAKRR